MGQSKGNISSGVKCFLSCLMLWQSKDSCHDRKLKDIIQTQQLPKPEGEGWRWGDNQCSLQYTQPKTQLTSLLSPRPEERYGFWWPEDERMKCILHQGKKTALQHLNTPCKFPNGSSPACQTEGTQAEMFPLITEICPLQRAVFLS